MKKTHIIGIVLIAIAMGTMFTLLGNSTSFSNFTEAIAKNGDNIQVAGTLVRSKPMKYDPEIDPNRFTFYMQDRDGKECEVVLLKSKPQDFERSEEVVATGHMEGGRFVAGNVLMKCPSKYNNGSDEWTSTDDVANYQAK
jgi:cytochrome c-type biogenesis protein CcmE